MGQSQTTYVGSGGGGGSSIGAIIMIIALLIAIAVAAVGISQPMKEQTKLKQEQTEQMKVAAQATAQVIKAQADADTSRIRAEAEASKVFAQSEAMVAKAPIQAAMQRDVAMIGAVLIVVLVLMFTAAFILFRHETHQALLDYRKTHGLPPTGTIELPALPDRILLPKPQTTKEKVPAKRLRIGVVKEWINEEITGGRQRE